MDKEVNLIEFLGEIEEMIKLLRENEANAIETVPEILSVVASVMGAFFSKVNLETWQQETILQRLNNLNQAYSCGDIIWLADVLQYEISDCIHFVMENV